MTFPSQLTLLRLAVLITLAFRASTGDAVGLGPMKLQSALGQPLRASVQLLGSDASSLSESCVRSQVAFADGAEIARPDVQLRRTNGKTEIVMVTRTTIDEPAVSLIVDITCSPTLHRDYQLLLDLRDGLPRVLSSGTDEPEPIAQRRAVASNTGAGGDSGTEQRKKRKSRHKPALAEPTAGLEEPDRLPPDEESVPVRKRAKGLPGARNVLKLSQDDVSFGAAGKKKSISTLKFSDSLAATIDAATINSEELAASKARFLAMLRGEDPVIAAQKEIRTLQGLVERNSASSAGTSAPNTPPTAPATSSVDPASNKLNSSAEKPLVPAVFRGVPVFNKGLITIAVLMLAAVGIASLLLRSSKRGTEKSNSKNPWWMAANATESREDDMLEAARLSAEKKKQKVKPAKPARAVKNVTNLYDEENAERGRDQVVDHYVQHYIDHPTETPTPAVEVDLPRSVPAPVAAEKRNTQGGAADGFIRDAHDDALRSLSQVNLVTAELVSDVMQEAEFWKMLNETQRAIDILENYCSAESPVSPVPWLYLGELYTGTGDLQRHAELRERFRILFNSRFDESDGADGDRKRHLEDYPHLIEKIMALWSEESIVPFLQSLLVNDRDTPREGFYLPVYREIMLLIDIAREREKILA